MKNLYQCKVCSETFSLLRYLRKHVTTPAVENYQPNNCQSHYSRISNLQENLRINHKIVPDNRPTEVLNCETKGRVQLISISNQKNTGYLKDDDSRNIEDEHACLKFEPDEEDELYFFDRDNPILPYTDNSNNSPQRFVNNEDKTKIFNDEANFIQAEEQDKTSIKRAISKRHNRRSRELGNYVSGVSTTEITSPAETTICRNCKLACTSLENLCIHYETLHQLPVVVLARVITNKGNPKCKRIAASNSGEGTKQNKTHKCGICSATFTSFWNLKNHKSSMHDGKMFNCNVCQKTFNFLGNLKQHKLSAHDGFRYKCNICPKEFHHLAHLNRHKSGIHSNVRFTCDICQKKFTRMDKLKEHKLCLHEQIRYKCNNCSKQFNSAQTLSFHKASVHEGVRYKCELCEKQFRQNSALKLHKTSSHEGVRYKCELCEKQFRRKNSLREHKAIRHDGVRYKCELCEKQFRQEKYLREHKARRHEGIRYKCDICPKQYSCMRDLKQHKSVRHSTQ